MRKIPLSLQSVKNSRIVKNSFWGIAANGGQTLLLSLFFVILARKYDPSIFALFLVATTIYQFLSAFSTLGLNQWFTRAVVKAENKNEIIHKFLKIQLISGIVFYLCNIGIAYLLYDNSLLQHLAIILGTNILFDNIIYGIRALNVAEFKQQKTFIILLIDSVLKFLASCILLIYPLPVIVLAIILIGIRLFTVNVFLIFGSTRLVSFRKLFFYKLTWQEVKKIVGANWAFVIIGSVSMIYWRIGNLIVSKTLPLKDVANYEISYRVFSLALVLPIIVSTTVFPSLVELYKAGQMKQFKRYFHNVFFVYLAYSLIVYTFFYSFADYIIPWAFGENFMDTAAYTREMFLAILMFPTALLQANVLVALHKERTDMWLNIVSLSVNVVFCFVGLYFYKSLTMINLAIFISFVVFHVCQDIVLIRNKITTLTNVVGVYLLIGLVVTSYLILSEYLHPITLFIVFWLVLSAFGLRMLIKPNGLLSILRRKHSINFLTK